MKPSISLLMICLALLASAVGCGPTVPTISLNQAIEKGDLKTVQQHIAAKSDLNKADSAGWTPMHQAVMKSNLAMVQALKTAGADVNRKGRTGKTPLDLAREKRLASIVQVLEQQKAEPRGRGLIDGGLGVSDVLSQ